MTALSWLQSRTPPAPEDLRTRMQAVLGDLGESPDDPFTACFDAAATLLEQTVSDDAAGRATALDLLAADALMTYAFEAAANDANALDERAVGAMRRLGALLTDGPNA